MNRGVSIPEQRWWQSSPGYISCDRTTFDPWGGCRGIDPRLWISARPPHGSWRWPRGGQSAAYRRAWVAVCREPRSWWWTHSLLLCRTSQWPMRQPSRWRARPHSGDCLPLLLKLAPVFFTFFYSIILLLVRYYINYITFNSVILKLFI